MKHLVTIDASQVEVEATSTGHTIEGRVDGTTIRGELERHDRAWTLTVDERPVHLRVVRVGADVWVAVGGEIYRCTVAEDAATAGPAGGLHSPNVTAPMPGKVIEVAVAVGQHVAAGDTLVVLEAMKMETALTAEAAGTVAKIHVTPDTRVEPGQTLVELTFD